MQQSVATLEAHFQEPNQRLQCREIVGEVGGHPPSLGDYGLEDSEGLAAGKLWPSGWISGANFSNIYSCQHPSLGGR